MSERYASEQYYNPEYVTYGMSSGEEIPYIPREVFLRFNEMSLANGAPSTHGTRLWNALTAATSPSHPDYESFQPYGVYDDADQLLGVRADTFTDLVSFVQSYAVRGFGKVMLGKLKQVEDWTHSQPQTEA